MFSNDIHLQRLLASDRHEALRRQAGASRLRRSLRPDAQPGDGHRHRLRRSG